MSKLILFKKKSRHYILDTFMIFLNLSNSYSIIPYILFMQHSRTINTGIIFVLNMCFLLIRFKKSILIPYRDSLFAIYFLLNIFNAFAGNYTDTGLFQPWIYLCANTSFYLILYNCYHKYIQNFKFNESCFLLTRGYLGLVLISVVGSILTFILVKSGVNMHFNYIGDRMDLFADNIKVHDAIYNFPYLSIIFDSIDIRFPYFQSDGFICGLYHEPHIITFMTFPAFFLLLSQTRSLKFKYVFFIMFIFIALLAGSTTNIIAFIICLIIMVFMKYRNKLQYLCVLLLLIPIAITIILTYIDTSVFEFMINKFNSGSKDYSEKMINFAFSPKTLIGSNFLNTDYVLLISSSFRDIGFVMFFLNIIFLGILLIKIIWVLFSKCVFNNYIGLFALYFFLHSMKVTMSSYSLSFLMFVIFLLTISTRDNIYQTHETSSNHKYIP